MSTSKKRRVTKRSQKPSVALSQIPSIQRLQHCLGFQRASFEDTRSFIDATSTWRNSYKTRGDFSIRDLLHWNNPAIQLEFKDMAETFLHDSDNGKRFWDVGRNWFHETDMQFPGDKETIVNLLMQLFWKKNKYAYNNSQYGSKRPDPGDSLRDGTGPIGTDSGATIPTSSISDSSSSKARLEAEIPLWIITHEPSPTRTLWVDGWLDASLSMFITGVSQVAQRSDAEKIKWTLSTPPWNTIIVISKDAEHIWEFAKKTFTATLEKERANLEGKIGDCTISIEPVYA